MPMDPRNYMETMARLQARQAATLAESWQRYTQLLMNLSDASRQPNGFSEFQRRYTDYMNNEAPAAWAKLAETGCQCYAAVIEATQEIHRQFFSTVEGADNPARSQTPNQPSSTVTAVTQNLNFVGFEGDEAVRPFVVTNRTQKRLEVAFEASEFLNVITNRPHRAEVRVDPASFVLAPGEERIVHCAVQITSDFAVGEEHKGCLRIVDFPDMSVELSVRNNGPAPKKTSKGGKGKRKRGQRGGK